MFEVILNGLILLAGIPVVIFIAECLLGLFPLIRAKRNIPDNVKTVILMPAHNEEAGIEKTLQNIQPSLGPNDTVMVVADNCTDRTAEIVRQLGLGVVERSDDDKRGKGYALDHGIKQLALESSQPDLVVVVDADCFLAEGALQKLKEDAVKTGRPVQACYLMRRGDIQRLTIKVSEFAFMVKNKIRMRGASRMGFPVPLTGTGMAFPWSVISQANLATGDIVEDMRLGVELVEAGTGAVYCDDALVYSYFPTSEEAEKTQRERWEHGHLQTLITFIPRLLKDVLRRGNVKALGMLLDLSIPPLSLLVMFLFASILGLALLNVFVPVLYLGLMCMYLISTIVTVLIVWAIFGRDCLSIIDFARIPLYLFSKIYIYIGFIIKRQKKWVRTDRD